MASARRVSLFEREVRISLSSAAVEILFDLASLLSEGACEGGGYFGSTMITIDLGKAAPLVSDPCDAGTVYRVAQLLAGDPRVRQRAREVAAAEAARLAGRPVGPAQLDLRVRVSGRNLHIDIDVEAGSGASGPTHRGSAREVSA